MASAWEKFEKRKGWKGKGIKKGKATGENV